MSKKQLLCIYVLVGAMVCLAGCSGPSMDLKPGSATQSIAQVLESEMEKADSQDSTDDKADENEGIPETNGSDETNDKQQESDNTSEISTSDVGDSSSSQDNTVDTNNVYIGNVDNSIADSDYIDLTGMSADMIYAVVYDMAMCRPEFYKDKTIKMEGLYSYYQDPNTNEEWYACIIEDARACCATGIEFIPLDNYKNPDDFPELLEPITVTGRFDYILDDTMGYITLILRDATLG